MTELTPYQLNALSVFLHMHREDILQAWRAAVQSDPELATARGLAPRALDDMLPRILDDLELRLRAEHALEAIQVELEQRKDAADHGLHRWQQGYNLSETMREWEHLRTALLLQFDQYAAAQRNLEPRTMVIARDVLGTLMAEGMRESAARYGRLQQADAASRLRDLESSLSALQALENERASLLRQAAHDLRGNVSVLANATALLSKTEVGGAERDHFAEMLQRQIREMGTVLSDLADLARLEAGHDPPRIEGFDVGESIQTYCALLRPAAAERHLFLNCSGPTPLRVQGDQLKVQRILQNLVLNAIRATQRGGIVVHWSTVSEAGPERWKLCIQDTGPGMAPHSAHPLRGALKEATEKAHEVESRATPPATLKREGSPPAATDALSHEGLGLSIVKRLADLLGAGIELETAPGHGTTIQITFPARYDAADRTGK